MDIGTFWVGQIPAQPLTITVYDDSGNTRDISSYSSVKLNLTGPNGSVDTTAGTLTVTSPTRGRITYTWPSVSLFNQPGQYVFQLELGGPSVLDYTNTSTVIVRQAGKVLR